MSPQRSAQRAGLFVALDTVDLAAATRLAGQLAPALGKGDAAAMQSGIKLGLEFFSAHGQAGVRQVMAAAGCPLFLDLKFHDIPNTVAGAIRAVSPLQPAIVNVHAQGGLAMMQAARKEADEQAARIGGPRPLVIAVTLLTSLDQGDLATLGYAAAVGDQVARLADLTQQAGLDGVVCSAHEISRLKAQCGADFRLIVPGIRPAGAQLGDQKRTMTPGEAVAAGADFLVVGRPITGAADPAAAVASILAEMGQR